MLRSLALFLAFPFIAFTPAMAQSIGTIPGTEPLTVEGDIASQMIDGVDRFLLREIDESVAKRPKFWQRDVSSPEAYSTSIEPNRKHLAHILGVRDARVSFAAPELVATTESPALIGLGKGFEIHTVRWPVFGNVYGEGLLLVPTKQPIVANVVAIPDADQTPEQLVGLAEGIPAESQFARRLAESGCRVIVPTLISREMKRRAPPGQAGRANLTNREYIYRPAFELGRHLIGYEIQKVLACVDWFEKSPSGSGTQIGVIGYGEGGLLALNAGALDARIDVTGVSGYFGSRQQVWNEPLDRNVFGLLEQFGDAEIASLVLPRALVIDHVPGPQLTLPSEGGGPAELRGPNLQQIQQEQQRLVSLLGELKLPLNESVVGRLSVSRGPSAVFCDTPVLEVFLKQLGHAGEPGAATDGTIQRLHPLVAADERQQRQMEQLDQYTQWLLRESPFVRKAFMKPLDTSSVAAYEQGVEAYRQIFRQETIGHFDHGLLPFNPRSRKTWETEKWTGYEVMLDVFPDVFAYGVLLVPKDLKPGEKRPVVVCQHGLEGVPTDVFLNDHYAYHDFAAKLCERGFITFAPQNIYIFKDRFRTLQRKANAVGKTLFSVMVPQHQQIVNWLKLQPSVDPERIAFYGLSYGGKSAMRIPALVTDYCLSICSADFNEWVLKNASTRENFSYVWTGEYEIFEFDLGSTFNYAEMAALICPRPFMVERGHFDGVGEDEWVAYEFAKVRHLYQAKLGIGVRTEIEWFVGPHTINGQGTFEFLHKHLAWPRP